MLMPKRFLEEHQQEVDRFFDTPRTLTMGEEHDLFGLRKDGAEVPIDIGLSQIETPEGLFTLASILDITDRKRSEYLSKRAAAAAAHEEKAAELERSFKRLHESHEKLKATQEQLVQAEKMATAGVLAAGIAHEINNPLTGVLGNADLLKKELEGSPEVMRAFPDFADGLKQIYEGADRCKLIIRNLLSYSRTSTGKMKQVLVGDVVGRMAGLVRVTLRHRKVSLTCKVPSDLWTWGDGGELQQVLINLVLNAADAMIPKGGQVTIRGYRETDATITLEVRDNGPGIPETIQGKIFEPFFTTKSSETGATGLGLSIARSIVENHGGKLTVESSSQGATFRVSLPAEVESAIEGATDQEVNAASAQGAKSELRVLVLDDDEFVLKIIRRLMESVSASQNLGWVVTATASPKEALQILRDTPHDVLLTDFLMDELNGIEVMEAAKKIQPEIVSVLMSGYADNFRKEIPPGILDVLDKPLDMEDLRNVMDRAWDTIRAQSDDD